MVELIEFWIYILWGQLWDLCSCYIWFLWGHLLRPQVLFYVYIVMASKIMNIIIWIVEYFIKLYEMYAMIIWSFILSSFTVGDKGLHMFLIWLLKQKKWNFYIISKLKIRNRWYHDIPIQWVVLISLEHSAGYSVVVMSVSVHWVECWWIFGETSMVHLC